MSNRWETKQTGNIAVVRGSDEEIKSLRNSLQFLLKTDIRDYLNIEFVVNETKLLEEKTLALSYLRNCLDFPQKIINDPTAFPEFHAELSDQEYEIPSIDKFNQFELDVSIYQALFLVEVLCPYQTSEEQFSYQKRFLTKKTVYQLFLFGLLPVSIETVYNQSNNPYFCKIFFADTSIASAEFINKQVKFACRMFGIKLCAAQFNDVDADSFSSAYMKKIADELECAIIKTPNFNIAENKGSFILYVLPNEFGEQKRTQIRIILNDLFGSLQLFQCERCKKFASQNKKEECVLENFEEQDEDAVFNNHQLTANTPSTFNFTTFQL